MADIKFSEFPKANQSKDSDEIAILQDGVNKMIPSPVLESKIINKTVSRVIEQGGASLNVINLKGVVPTYADLATVTPTPQVNDAYQVEADGLVYVYTENGFQSEGDGFVVQAQPTGVVEQDNPNSVSGGEVYVKVINKSDLNVANLSINEFRKDLIQNGNINSSGVFVEGAGKAVIGQQVIGGQSYYISGIAVDANKRIAFKDANGALLGTVMNMSVMPRGITAPTTAVTVDYDIKTTSDADDTVFANFQFEKGTTPTPYVAPDNQISKISDNKINASSLAQGNAAPNATELKNAVPLGQMYNEYQGKIYNGTLKTDVALAQHRNLLNEVITDVKVTGAKEGKVYMLKTIAFKHTTVKDFTTFIEGVLNPDGTVTEQKQFVPYASGSVNAQIPDSLTGKAYSKYELGEGIIVEIWFDFDRKVNWTLFLYPIANDANAVAINCYFNRKKVGYTGTRDFIRRNYQGSILSGALQTSSNANALNLINSVIEDFRITGAKDTDVFQIFTICFDHPTLKDYVRFWKGHLENGEPVWDSNETLYNGQEHPDYPSTLTGKCRAVYNLSNGVTLEIWFDFDKRTFAQGSLIAVSDTTSSLGYKAYISKAKMLPENKNIPTGTYPTFSSSKIIFFGDSITATNGGQTTWVQQAVALLGNPTWVNYADGGAAFRQRSITGIDDMPTQIANSASQTGVNAVVIALGTNEYHSPAPPVGNNTPNVGSFDETMARPISEVISNVETLGINATMYDAIRYAFYKIQERWNCKIYVCLPIQRAAWNYQHVETLYTALDEMAIAYGAETIDLRRCGIVTDFEVSGSEGRDLSDGLHPKDATAYGKIAKMVVSAVRNTLVI